MADSVAECWQSSCGTVTLYQGDCLQVLPTLAAGSVDAVVTDPPYGINHKSHGQRFARATPIAGDHSLEIATRVREWCSTKHKACCMFFSPYRPLIGWRNVLCWVKGPQVGIGGDRAKCWKRDFELIGIEGNGPLAGKRDSAVLNFPSAVRKQSGHFAEKPVGLVRYLVEKLGSENIIFDPFMGSGTTGVACVQTGRRFVGVEIDENYFAIAKERIQKALDERTVN